MANYMKQSILFLIIALFVMPHQGNALIDGAEPLVTDSRFRTYIYNPYEVYTFTGHFTYQTIIEFSHDEKIASVSMGDPSGWQINPGDNRMFLKPIDDNATTNMTVITDKRIYHFEMYAEEAESIRDPELIFVLRFVYPEDGLGSGIMHLEGTNEPDLTEPEKFNFEYSISGKENIAPIKIFDDGEFTYFEFEDLNAEIPAFFLVDSLGEESLVNYRITGRYLVVERVASQFTLRHGTDITCVFNDRLPLEKRLKKKKKKKFWIF